MHLGSGQLRGRIFSDAVDFHDKFLLFAMIMR